MGLSADRISQHDERQSLHSASTSTLSFSMDGVKQSQLCSYTESKESGEWKCKRGGRLAPMESPRCGPLRRLESSCMETKLVFHLHPEHLPVFSYY